MSVKYCSCGSLTQVVDSRPNTDGSIRRRRQCPRCLSRTSTYEISALERRRIREMREWYNSIKKIVDTPSVVR